MTTLLEVEGLRHRVPHLGRQRARRRRRQLRRRRRRDAGARRRVGLRQERDGALDHAAGAGAGRAHRRRAIRARRRRPARARPSRRCARCAATRIAMIFQEPMTSLNPVFTVGDQIAEAVALHRPVSAARGVDARGRACSTRVGHPGRRRRARATTRTSFGRHAPARDDRDGARLRARAADRRRADDRARRDDPGPDPRAARRAARAARAWRCC